MSRRTEKLGVVIAVSKTNDSTTSYVYVREVDENEFGGFGKPFQLSIRSNDFSKHDRDNDILTDEEIGLGTILKYEQVGEEYLYTKNTKKQPQVSTQNTIALCLFVFLTKSRLTNRFCFKEYSMIFPKLRSLGFSWILPTQPYYQFRGETNNIIICCNKL